MPSIERLYKANENLDTEVLTIIVGENLETVDKIIKNENIVLMIY